MIQMKLLLAALLLSACYAMDAHPLTVSGRTVHQLESGPVSIIDLNWVGELFSVVPPPSATLEMDEPAGRVTFSFTNFVSVTVTFSTNRALPDTATLVKSLLPGSEETLVEEFLARCGDAQGRGVELAALVQGNEVRCRAAFFPIKGGTAAMALNCGAGEIESGRQALGAIMTSFRHARVR